ncbi:hypothetical protein DVH05_000064 [Phytophthora capsici]|nr:hypothetical protein DVH05_000064 [Phytophthora capsici]|eukprot:jgi/Phyca11/124675/e_gw1.54.210.1
MLRRPPTRVEERADVSAEYQAYLQEKEPKPQGNTSNTEQAATASHSMAARQEARRQDVRSRIGLNSSN